MPGSRRDDGVTHYPTGLILATAALVTGLAVMCHEGAHVLVGWLAGGAPTLLTTTEVKGDFRSLTPWGFVAFGASGSLVNVAFCGLGWWALMRAPAEAGSRLFAWFLFAVNGTLVANKMLVETAAGFGDWMTILHPFPLVLQLRVLVAVLGVAALVWLVRACAKTLGGVLLPEGETSRRRAEAVRVVGLGAVAAVVLVLGGAVASPVGTTRGTLLAVGAGLGPYVPIAFAIRRVPRATPLAPTVAGSTAWPWYLAAEALAALLWLVLGPGVDLTRWF